MQSAKKEKILILVPGSNAIGGITNYYRSIYPKFQHDVTYFVRGTRTWPDGRGKIYELLRLIKDYTQFIIKLKKEKYDLVQTTTAFGKRGYFRDSIFILIAKYFNAKVIVFIRGWVPVFFDTFEKKHLKLFRMIYLKTDAIIELANSNITMLRKCGYWKPIFLETTIVDESLLKGINKTFLIEKENRDSINILYLGRIEKAKGIYEAIQTFEFLKNQYENLSLSIAGSGSELSNIRQYIKTNKIKNINILGFVEGKRKVDAYKNADIYLFPSYSEGMPNSVLEAMAFGLPVVTRAVGGLVDFFENIKNGFITDSMQAIDFAEYIKKLIDNKDLRLKIAVNNYLYSKRFYSSSVVKRIEDIFNLILNTDDNK